MRPRTPRPPAAPSSPSCIPSQPHTYTHNPCPRCDELAYRIVSLPNGLRAALVSDPDTDKAAAALDVRVGSLLDPPELQGLAHCGWSGAGGARAAGTSVGVRMGYDLGFGQELP
jgi:hypothetical protein